MKVKMILPALKESANTDLRSLKYSRFPPLGLATLAGYLDESDHVSICDEHVETLDLDDEPDLVVLQVYITSAYRAYAIADQYKAKGAYVVMGGLHPTALSDECAAHANTVCLGPGEDTFPAFLADFKAGHPASRYQSAARTLEGQPPMRRDLIKRHLYLAPNSLVVSRGCPHRCDFCYKNDFYRGGRSFYTQTVDDALAQIEGLRGRHLFFLDDNLFGDIRFAEALFDGMKGMNRVWQAAGTVQSILVTGLLEKAVESGLRSLFVGFESINASSLSEQNKVQNLDRDYNAAIRKMHGLGVMVNGSFVFGMDHDDADTPRRTVEWAIEQGIETAAFHIMTPYPGTALYDRLVKERRITSRNWSHYDTKHVVFTPAKMTADELQEGQNRAYRDFYRWSSIYRSARAKEHTVDVLRHLAYAGGFKKMEPFWSMVIKARCIASLIPLLEFVLNGAGISRRLSGRQASRVDPGPFADMRKS
ncbi:MAG: B12-binding domain-containing radical SAM protein [Armatimonadota bacterium]